MALTKQQKQLAALQRLANRTAVGAFPEAEVPGSGGPSLGGALKEIGSNTLKSLSVPLAAAWTTGAKATGRDLSWKNALGDFYKNAKGQTGSQGAMSSFGIDNKWVQFGLGIATDPMWLVGGGLIAASAKTARGANAARIGLSTGRGAKAASATSSARSALDDIAKLPLHFAKPKVKGALPKTPRDPRPTRALLNAPATPVRRATATQGRSGPTLKSMFGKSIKGRRSKNFTTLEKEMKILEREAAKKGLNVDEILNMDEFGRLKSVEAALGAVREAYVDLATRAGLNYALRVGLGKHSVRINLGKSASKHLIGNRNVRKGALMAGRVRQTPIEEIAHALRRSGTESLATADEAMLRVAEKFGLATKEGNRLVIDEKAATILGMYRSMVSLSDDAGAKFRAKMIEQGKWGDTFDDFVKNMDERYQYIGLVQGRRVPGGREFQRRLDELTEQIEDKLAKNPNADVSREVAEIQKLTARGMYTPQGARAEDIVRETKKFQEDVRAGRATMGDESLRIRPEGEQYSTREMFDNPFAAISEKNFYDDLIAAGFSKDEALEAAQEINLRLTEAGWNTIGSKLASKDKVIRPEWNVMTLANRAERKYIMSSVDRQIDELLRSAGLKEGSELYNAVKLGRRMENPAGWSGTKVGRGAIEGVRHLKGLFTFANTMPHYLNNAWGDFMNSLITGNMRHLSPGGAALPGFIKSNHIRRMANAGVFRSRGQVDEAILNQTFQFGKRTMSGREMVALSRMTGMGTGYVGTDIAMMTDVFETADQPWTYFWRGMQRFQLRRENAQRLQTWAKHIRSGDDPMTAGWKTLRVHFDYGQLTDFEKLTLRNLIMFYTWIKRNALLQAQGIVERPGLYSSVFSGFERTREKFPNEPDYYAEQGAVPIPGLGALVMGSPWSDVHRWDMTWDGFKKEVVGSLVPPVRIPAELSFNQQAFSGGRISDYEGSRAPSWIAQALSKLGVQGTPLNIGPTTAKAGGESVMGMGSKWAYGLSQLAGPQGSLLQSAFATPDYEGENRLLDHLKRGVGIKPQTNKPEAFERARKYLEAKKKADETRRKNAQGG